MPYRDLREFLDFLRGKGELKTCDREVDNRIEIEMDAELMETLMNIWPGEVSGLSPFRYEKGGQPNLQGLISAGVCNPDGSINPMVRPAILIIEKKRLFHRNLNEDCKCRISCL